jgi:hypothetical protein
MFFVQSVVFEAGSGQFPRIKARKSEEKEKEKRRSRSRPRLLSRSRARKVNEIFLQTGGYASARLQDLTAYELINRSVLPMNHSRMKIGFAA